MEDLGGEWGYSSVWNRRHKSVGNLASLVALLNHKDNSHDRGGVLSYCHEVSSKEAGWLILREKLENPAFNHLDVLAIKATKKDVN